MPLVMAPRRWIPPLAGFAVFLLVNGAIALQPGPTGRWVKSVTAQVPDVEFPREGKRLSDNGSDIEGYRLQRMLASATDGAVRFYAFGDPGRLAQADVALTPGSDAPDVWIGRPVLRLEWKPLAPSGLRYEVLVAEEGQPIDAAESFGFFPTANATVSGLEDGRHRVWVRPWTTGPGHASSFGPFLVDSTPPPAPMLVPPAKPTGYRFKLSWSESRDASGIRAYELERRYRDASWETVSVGVDLSHQEDQVGAGDYVYRVRAVNGAGVPSDWSNSVPVVVEVRASMQNPGPGLQRYGVHSNYTGFLHLWDLSAPSRYVSLPQVPTSVAGPYLKEEPGVEVGNATLRRIVADVVGTETNSLRIAQTLFEFLFNRTDYDSSKLDDPEGELQRAGLTLDKGRGICGDLAVLYITLLRIAGVPARPVHGYLDNARSGIGGFHMWVEVYVGPVADPRPWLSVDVSGVTGTFEPRLLYPYFGIFNPDYLALGTELDYRRFGDEQWNTWARYRYQRLQSDPEPRIVDRTTVVDYESEYGNLFVNLKTRERRYLACQDANEGRPDDPCPQEAQRNFPPGFNVYYGVKGLSKKRIDYGYNLESSLPACLRMEIRYPLADPFGAVLADQAVIYRAYENTESAHAQVEEPSADGWIVFRDGTRDPADCF